MTDWKHNLSDNLWPDFNEAIDSVAAAGAPTVAHLISPKLTSFSIDQALYIDGHSVDGQAVVAAAAASTDDIRTRALNRIALRTPNPAALGSLAADHLRATMTPMSPQERTDFIHFVHAQTSPGVDKVLVDLVMAPQTTADRAERRREPKPKPDDKKRPPQAPMLAEGAKPKPAKVAQPEPRSAGRTNVWLGAALVAGIVGIVALTNRESPTTTPTTTAPLPVTSVRTTTVTSTAEVATMHTALRSAGYVDSSCGLGVYRLSTEGPSCGWARTVRDVVVRSPQAFEGEVYSPKTDDYVPTTCTARNSYGYHVCRGRNYPFAVAP